MKSSGVYRKLDPLIPGPKAQKARCKRRRLRQRQRKRDQDQVQGITTQIRMNDNVKGRTLKRAGRYLRRRMDSLRAINDYRRFNPILTGQKFFGRTKADRARVSQRGRTKS